MATTRTIARSIPWRRPFMSTVVSSHTRLAFGSHRSLRRVLIKTKLLVGRFQVGNGM